MSDLPKFKDARNRWPTQADLQNDRTTYAILTQFIPTLSYAQSRRVMVDLAGKAKTVASLIAAVREHAPEVFQEVAKC